MRWQDLLQSIRSDWVAHERDWTRPGFRALAAYRFGTWVDARPTRLVRAPLRVIHLFLYRHARNVYGIEVPSSARIGQHVVFEHQHGIVVHGSAQIGDHTIVRQGVTIGNRSLDKPFEAPQIGRHVNIGAGAKLLGGIVIGDHATIGANAVVVRDVLPGQTVVGIPARPVGRTADVEAAEIL
jgi:serine acetyltransferase